MHKLTMLAISSLVAVSFSAQASSELISHKERAPKNIAMTVTNDTNGKVEKMIAMQKKSKRSLEIKSDSQVFLADYVVDGVGKVGELTTIESYVSGYFINNGDVLKNYYIETSACTDLLFADNCAQVEDIISIEPKSETPLMHKITIQYKFDQADEHSPTTVTTVTELKDPNLDIDGYTSFTTGNIGKLTVKQ